VTSVPVPRQESLVIEFQGDVIRTLPLTFSVLTIGRSPENDLTLQHPGVSRQHVELSLTAGGLVVTDLESSNGSFIDDTRLLPHQPTRVEQGQTLRIGPFILAIRRSPTERPNGGVRPVRPEANGDAPRGPSPTPVGDYVQVVPTHPRRPTVPVPAPIRLRSRYLDYLPTIFAENDFLGRYLLIFESIWEPLEQRQDHIAMYFDPATCPEPLLGWLAGWFDMRTGSHWPEHRVRGLVDQMTELYRYRGTRYGLAKMIEIWTGITPEISESPDRPFVFNVRLKVPAGVDFDRQVVEDVLLEHKPAASGFVLTVES
jgi:phage tail-like protein